MHAGAAGDDEGCADDLVPGDCFAEYDECEEGGSCDGERREEGNGGDGQPLNGFVVTEDDEKTGDEPVAEQDGQKCEGKFREFGAERVGDEGGEEEEAEDGDCRSDDDDELRV